MQELTEGGPGHRPRELWVWRTVCVVTLVALGSIALAHALVLPRLQDAMAFARLTELPGVVEVGLMVTNTMRSQGWFALAVLAALGVLCLTGVIDGFAPAIIVVNILLILVLCTTFTATYRFGSRYLPTPGWTSSPTMGR